MKTTGRFGLGLALALLLGAPSARASFTVNFYETTNNTPDTPVGSGEFEVGPIVALPAVVTPGFVVLLESGNPTNSADQMNQSLWSDVLRIFNSTIGGTTTSSAQLLSDPATFPTVAAVLAAANAFRLEVGPPTVYSIGDGNGGFNVYNIYSDAPPDIERNPVPEPSSLLMGATGVVLAGFAGYRRRLAAKVA